MSRYKKREKPSPHQLEVMESIRIRPDYITNGSTKRALLELRWVKPTDEPRTPMDPVKYQITEAGVRVMPAEKRRQA